MARKVQIVLNDDVWAMLQELVPKGQRSEVVRQAVAKALERRERQPTLSTAPAVIESDTRPKDR